MLRYTIHFTGHVQGVGFRYTATHVAEAFEVNGYVQNLTDGRVLLVAEGEEAQLDGMVQTVCDRMAGYITDHKTNKSEPTGEFADIKGLTVQH